MRPAKGRPAEKAFAVGKQNLRAFPQAEYAKSVPGFFFRQFATINDVRGIKYRHGGRSLSHPIIIP
jgi:TRAP-type mannitol/chloroaromatic compound transport system substrate-binding protein